jgi:putative ABC transport system permease protein
MFSIRLGFKNLSRQKRRNIITIFVIAFAFFGYLFIESLFNGIEEMSFDNIKNFETGDIQISHPAYWEEKDDLPLENLIIWNEDLKESLLQTSGVEGISPELRFSANLNNGIDEMGVIGVGIIPEYYNQVFQTQDYFIEGSLSALNENKAIIGARLAELMDLEIDDYIILLVRTKEDTFNTIDVEVGGVVNTLNPMMNTNTVLLPLSTVQQSLNVDDNVTMISLKTTEVPEENIIQSLESTFQGKELAIQAYSWQESAQGVVAFSEMKKGGVGAIMSVVLLIGMVGIINNVILSSLERTSEIGMMKALGMKEWEIVFVFMVEATGIGVLGGLTGCLLGYFGVNWMVNSGMSFKALYGDWLDWSQYGIPIVDRVYGAWNYSTFSYIFFLGVIVAILSSIIPAYWAANKDPVEAIYHR